MLVFHSRIYYGQGSKFLRVRGYCRSAGPSPVGNEHEPGSIYATHSPTQRRNNLTLSDDIGRDKLRLWRAAGMTKSPSPISPSIRARMTAVNASSILEYHADLGRGRRKRRYSGGGRGGGGLCLRLDDESTGKEFNSFATQQ